MDRVDVIKGVANQRVYFYPPEGRPAATPTVEIKDISGAIITAATTTDVTIDLCSTTIAVIASPGAAILRLAAITNIVVGREYLTRNAIGQSERVTVIGIDAATKDVYLDEAIEYTYAVGGTFTGTAFSRKLAAAEVAELAEMHRARAVYAVDGVTYILEVPFDVVLTPLPNVLTVALLKQYRPGLNAQEHGETRGSDLAGLRAAAWDRVRKGIRRAGWRPALLRTPDDVEEWALAEFDLLCQQNGIRVLRGDWTQPEALRELKEQRALAKTQCLGSLHFLDLDESDGRGDDEERPGRMSFLR